MHKYNFRTIRVIRERLGLSLEEMSERSGVDRLRMGAYESGEANPTIHEFIKLWDLANEEEKSELINAP